MQWCTPLPTVSCTFAAADGHPKCAHLPDRFCDSASHRPPTQPARKSSLDHVNTARTDHVEEEEERSLPITATSLKIFHCLERRTTVESHAWYTPRLVPALSLSWTRAFMVTHHRSPAGARTLAIAVLAAGAAATIPLYGFVSRLMRNGRNKTGGVTGSVSASAFCTSCVVNRLFPLGDSAHMSSIPGMPFAVDVEAKAVKQQVKQEREVPAEQPFPATVLVAAYDSAEQTGSSWSPSGAARPVESSVSRRAAAVHKPGADGHGSAPGAATLHK